MEHRDRHGEPFATCSPVSSLTDLLVRDVAQGAMGQTHPGPDEVGQLAEHRAVGVVDADGLTIYIAMRAIMARQLVGRAKRRGRLLP